MNFTESVAIMKDVVDAILPFLVVFTVTVVLVKTVLKALKGRL